MNLFWFRYGMFAVLWGYLIIAYSTNTAVSLFFFALASGLFFFLSLQKPPLYVYVGTSLAIVAHGLLLTNDSLITILLLAGIATVGAFKMQEEQMYAYVVFQFLLTIALPFLQGGNWLETAAVGVFLYVLILVLHRFSAEREELKTVHENLLGEFRHLKRVNMAAEREARIEERTKIARDIHDSVGHRLTALIMKLEMLAIQSGHEEFRELKQMAQEGLEETREAVKALQTEEHEGISTVVHLIRKLEAESQIVVQFTVKQGVLLVPLTNEKSIVLYRALQEALTNAMRHSQSREVNIMLGKTAAGDVSFEVRNTLLDAGRFTFGFGLDNMKRRVEEIDGNLDVYQTETEFVVSGTIPGDREE